jgi:hypothetical protein
MEKQTKQLENKIKQNLATPEEWSSFLQN